MCTIFPNVYLKNDGICNFEIEKSTVHATSPDLAAKRVEFLSALSLFPIFSFCPTGAIQKVFIHGDKHA